jgi:hypothetical protein
VGVALAGDRLVAALPRGRELETTDTADLRHVFKELRARSGLARATVAVALVPPLVDVRTLSLPPLTDDERRLILERDARRYFVGLAEPWVVGSRLVGGRVVAAAAQAALVTDLEVAVAAAGWSLGAIVPAHAAWAAGVRRRWPERATGQVTVSLPHATEVLTLVQGHMMERRRLRTSPTHEALFANPVCFAARYASSAAGPELVSPAQRMRRMTTARRVARGLWLAATACLVLAVAIDYWGLARALAAVRAKRMTLAPQVTRAMAARDSLGALTGGIATLQRLTITAPRWSAFLTNVADFLPRDAHLVALRAAGDSAVLEGVAQQAAGVFEALQQMPRLAGVRAGAPIQRDVLPDGSVREHFAVNTWLSGAAGQGHP